MAALSGIVGRALCGEPAVAMGCRARTRLGQLQRRGSGGGGLPALLRPHCRSRVTLAQDTSTAKQAVPKSKWDPSRFACVASVGAEFSRQMMDLLHKYDEKVASFWAATDLSTEVVDIVLAGKKDAAVTTYRDIETRLEMRTEILMQIESVEAVLGKIAKVHHLGLADASVMSVWGERADDTATGLPKESLWAPQPQLVAGVFANDHVYHSALEELREEEERWRTVIRRTGEPPKRRFADWELLYDECLLQALSTTRASLEARLRVSVLQVQADPAWGRTLERLTAELQTANATATEAVKRDPEMVVSTQPLTADFVRDFVAAVGRSTDDVCLAPGKVLGPLSPASENLIRSLRVWHYTASGKQNIPFDLEVLEAYTTTIKTTSAEFASSMWEQVEAEAVEVRRIEEGQVHKLQSDRKKLQAEQSKLAVELGSEGEAESLLEEIRALNRTIARFTSADENPELIKQLFDRVVTIRESLWLTSVKEKEEEWMQYTQDSGAARASATVNKLGDTAKTLCQVSQFKLQQQGLEALVAHRDWSEAAMKRTSWRGFLFSGLGFLGTFSSVIVGIVFARIRTGKIMAHTTAEVDRVLTTTSAASAADSAIDPVDAAVNPDDAVVDADDAAAAAAVVDEMSIQTEAPSAASTSQDNEAAAPATHELISVLLVPQCGNDPKDSARHLHGLFRAEVNEELRIRTAGAMVWLRQSAHDHGDVLALSAAVGVIAGVVGAAVTQLFTR